MRLCFVRHVAAATFAFGVCLVATPRLPGAEPGAARYAATVSAEPGLVSYWRLDGDLKDAKGKADGRAEGGRPQFGDGPGGGQALVLSGGRFVTMGETPELDLKQTTVELWFQPNFQPGIGYNPCIIAKRAHGDHGLTRFSIHVESDYSHLDIWNGRSVIRYRPPGGRLRKGQWYHLAVTCTEERMQTYVDGLPCEPEGGSGVFNFGRVNLPLSIGSSTPRGQELLDGRIGEVAVYRRALSEAQIAEHVDAMGWQRRRLKLAAAARQRAEREKRLRAQQEAERSQRRAALLSDPALMARGTPTIYRGDHLGAISLGLGGIGTGSIQIDGRAARAVWQIFNNHQQAAVPHSFFAVRVKADAAEPVVRALQTEPVGPFAGMKALSFRGEYPFGWYEFEDAGVPVRVSLETFNPLVPLDVQNSAIPCAIFNVSASNPTDRPVEVSFLAAQQNAVGYLADRPIQGRAYPGYGGNKNRILRDGKATVLHLTSDKPKDAPGAGDMALMVLAGDATATASWEGLDKLAKRFAAAGTLAGPEQAGPSPAGKTLDGALAVSLKLKPGAKRTAAFVLTWHFPNGSHGAGGWGGSGNMYANWWPDALAVARHLEQNLDELTRRTRLYHDSLYESNLPYWLLDRISSQVAVLRSQTCFWTKDGYFGGWEGCCRASGCCQGNCNHVWHYAQAHARLFPSIARRMRQQEFHFQSADGAIPHRQPKSFPAFDGQCGAVLNSYREHLMSADRKWLGEHWPSLKRAMEYIIVTWDKDEDGVLAGPQWNTLDGALGGSSSWLGTLYLAALAAAEKMAILQGEPQAAQRYAKIRAVGSKTQDATLFNGEYYIQIPEPQPHEDYATGCHIDQVLGQWWAHQLDLGWLYPPQRVRSALRALVKYNFRGNFQGLKQLPRQFVADDDPGLQMITWPKGPRPAKVIRYGDEVMTGFEYSAAAAMVQAGLLRDGLLVARAVSIRYDGRLRTGLTASDTASWGYSGNPFGDDECGKFYARAMSVWSLLLACQGFIYDGPAGLIGFKPVWQPEDHVSFFTAAEGWGVFRQRRRGNQQTERIEVRHGKLRVASLVFELPEGAKPTEVSVTLGGRRVAATFTSSDHEIRINLKAPVILDGGSALEIDFRGKVS
jgi:non-lysosomal glucosylceramidase